MIPEPFCWITGSALEAIRRDVEPQDRKAARLLLLALSEMAMLAYDGAHVGFSATVADVMAAAELSEGTYKKARRVLEAASILSVEHPSPRSTTWLLRSPGGSMVAPLMGSTVDPPRARQTAWKKEELEFLTEPCAKTTDPVGFLFEQWRTTMPGRSGCRLTSERRKKIEARMRTYTVDDLSVVIEEVTKDRFLCGENDRGRPFNDFRTIFRSDEKVEELLDAARMRKDNVIPLRPPSAVAAAGKQQRSADVMAALASFGQQAG